MFFTLKIRFTQIPFPNSNNIFSSLHVVWIFFFDHRKGWMIFFPLLTIPRQQRRKVQCIICKVSGTVYILGQYTVVKWGHTEGIEREKTLSQKYTGIALDFWRDEFFLVIQIWGQNIIGGQFLEHYHLIWNCPWFLKRFLIFQIWGYYLQKVNAKCPQISDEKDKFFFHW